MFINAFNFIFKKIKTKMNFLKLFVFVVYNYQNNLQFNNLNPLFFEFPKSCQEIVWLDALLWRTKSHAKTIFFFFGVLSGRWNQPSLKVLNYETWIDFDSNCFFFFL